MPEVSLVITAQDRYSDNIRKISAVTRSLSKDVQDLESLLHTLSTQKTSIQVDVREAKRALEAAEKQFEATGSAADDLNMQLQEENYNNIVRNLKLVTQTARETEQQLVKMEDSTHKSQNSMSDLLKGLKGTELPKLLEISVTGAIGTGLNSMLGDSGGKIANGLLSGVTSGAMMGASTGLGLPGAAVGALIGGISGLISGATEDFKARDAAFITYYNGVYDTHAAEMDQAVTDGSALAGSRETSRFFFANELGETNADAFLASLLNMANNSSFEYDDLLGISKTMMHNGQTPEDILLNLTRTADAGAAKGLSSSEIGALATSLEQMGHSKNVDISTLTSMKSQGFDVFQWLSEELKLSQEDLNNKLSNGELSGTYVSELILRKFSELPYQGMAEKQNQSFEGRSSTLQSLQENIQAAGGEGYNTLRKEGMEQDIAAYGGALGEELEEAYAAIGRGRAAMENLEADYTRDALSAVTMDTELEQTWDEKTAQELAELRQQYVAAKQAADSGDNTAGIEMEHILESAQGLAQEQFEASDLYKQNLDAEEKSLDALRDNTAAVTAATELYGRQLAETKGMVKGFHNIFDNGNPPGAGVTNEFSEELEAAKDAQRGHPGKGAAFGLDRVPYDNYPALLHEGERVLTASQARQQGRGAGGVSVQVSVGSLVVREEADLEKIAYYLMEEAKLRRMAGEYKPVS